MQTLSLIREELRALAVPGKAETMMRFFKTGKDEYGEGDIFIGVSVPNQRLVAKTYHANADQKVVEALLDSEIHEERLTGVFILVQKYKNDKKKNEHEKWVNLYLNKTNRINNWDLVDSSAHLILGDWLEKRDRSVLNDLALSESLWENRIAMISTLHFIQKNEINDTLKIVGLMMQHKHDLIHKACGWMLREAWQKHPDSIEQFLDLHAREMPRTMLRYTIEKMNETLRQQYLRQK